MLQFIKNRYREFKSKIPFCKGELIIRFFLNKKPKYDKKYKFSICAIFKDEAPFLREWIEMNHLVGVEHFYVYNNNSSDNFREVMQPYVDNNLVTLVDFPYNHAQFKAYQNFYETYRQETQWVAFLDIDEFLCPNSHLTLEDWIRPYENYPVIQIYWKMFGTSGLMKHDYNKLVTEQYYVSWKDLYHCGKCLINTDYDVIAFDASCHHATTVWMEILGKNRVIHPVNIFHRSTIGQGDFIPVDESNPSIQINHYWSKAWDIYDAKRRKTDVYFEENPKKNIDYFLFHENKNCSVDYNIYKYLMQLKLRLNDIQ